MLRPERMSRVSVTGSKRVMDDVIEAVHDLHLLHVTEYQDEWEGFEPGDPIEGADDTAQRLVTVRALLSTLDVDPDEAGPANRIVTDEELAENLEEIRQEVNELDDRRADLRDELGTIEERIDTFEPFATLGIDLDLLWGYDSLAVAVGEGDAAAVEAALEDAENVAAFEVFAEDDAVAAFVYPAEGTAAEDVAVEDLLVGAEFTSYQVPEASGVPEEYLAELRHRKEQVRSRLETVETEIDSVRVDVAGFLLAAEEKLTVDLDKLQAPLRFATTSNAFIAEGWLPTDRYNDLVAALDETVGEHVEITELSRADYDRHGHAATDEPVQHDEEPAPGGQPTAVDGGGATGDADEPEVKTDGGSVVTMGQDEPPVLQDNPSVVQPFELLTNAVGRPSYTELDPTIVLFLTFPLMFGFMIGDVGYGLIYTGLGYYLYRSFDSAAFQRFGIVAAAAGVMTVVFGILYGEIFGLHLITDYLWVGVVGLSHAPIQKGLSPATVHWAEAWFVVTALFGLLHLDIGYVFEYVENNALHGAKDAILETGSWLFAINGLWLFVFSRLYAGNKPDLLFEVFNEGEGAAFALGFSGFPAWVGWVGIAMIVVGFILLVVGPTYEIIEFHQVLAHVLSYLRIGAVLLAKAGMAFAVNLLFFGAYETHGEFHFLLAYGPEHALATHEGATVLFPGLIHLGAVAAVFGVAVFLIGHLVVLLLGITSAGIQSIRLEYFEFFSKFYEGGGTVYSPFGHVRRYTADE